MKLCLPVGLCRAWTRYDSGRMVFHGFSNYHLFGLQRTLQPSACAWLRMSAESFVAIKLRRCDKASGTDDSVNIAKRYPLIILN